MENDKDQDLALILDYLGGQLDEAEQKQFEDRLETEPALKEYLTQERIHLLGMKVQYRLEEKAQLKKLYQKNYTPASTRKLIPNWAYAAAASILLLGLFWLSRDGKSNLQNPEMLAQAYYEPYPISLSRTAQNQEDSLIAQASLHYQQAAYKKALPYFQQLAVLNPGENRYPLYQAICQIELKNYQAAKTQLLELTEKEDPFTLEASQWFLAICYLQLQDVPAAKGVLNSITQTDIHYKKKEATELLEKIGQP